jgi:hypothetical protein
MLRRRRQRTQDRAAGTPTPVPVLTSDAYTGAAKTIPLTGGIGTVLVPASTTAPPAGTTVTR